MEATSCCSSTFLISFLADFVLCSQGFSFAVTIRHRCDKEDNFFFTFLKEIMLQGTVSV